jgi:hypothetical protein
MLIGETSAVAKLHSYTLREIEKFYHMNKKLDIG